MDYTQILIKPLVSEKASLAKDAANQVVFFVNPAANKIQIRRAVEEAFKVEVANVNVVRRTPTLKKKFGKVQGQIAGYKKAYVTLAAGHKIEFFEGV